MLLILDSLHTKDHVLDELRAYWEIVNVGGYIADSRNKRIFRFRPISTASSTGRRNTAVTLLHRVSNSRVLRDDC